MVAVIQSAFSAAFVPFTNAVAPLSQVNTSAAELTTPSILKTLRNVARSLSFAGAFVQIHCGSATVASGDATMAANVMSGKRSGGFMGV